MDPERVRKQVRNCHSSMLNAQCNEESAMKKENEGPFGEKNCTEIKK